MANNELSGPIIATFLAKELLNRAHRKYTYRFVFVPETIGSIVYISKHLEHLKQHVLGGYVITCAGDSGPFSFLQSKTQSSLINRITEQILKESNKEYKLYSFLDRGSDERQYSSPGVDLDIGSLMRSKHGTYPEYHTSLDNLDFVRPDSLYETYDMYLRCIEVLEHNDTYQAALCCEPQLGPRGLYPTLGTRQNKELVRHTMDTLAYCDGRHDTLALSQITGYPFAKTRKLLQKLAKEGLVHKV
jgi:aminopeptidase-like protein